MKNFDVKKFFALFIFLAASSICHMEFALAESSQVKVTMGELSSEVVGPLLEALAAKEMAFLPGKVDMHGKEEGYKYHAVAKELIFENLFRYFPNNRYSIVFGPNGQIFIRSQFPNVIVTGKLGLEAHKKSNGSIFGNFASGLGEIDRTYSLSLTGLESEVSVRIGLVGGQIKVLNSQLTNLRFGRTKIKLKKSRDGILVDIINALSRGEINRMLKEKILKQMEGQKLKNQMTEPVSRLVKRLAFPASFLFEGPMGLKAQSQIVDLQTGNGLATQFINIELNGSNENSAFADRTNELNAIESEGSKKPGLDRIHFQMPMGFIEDIFGALARKGIFTYSGQQFGVNFEVLVKEKISAIQDESKNEILWKIPISLDLTSPMITKKIEGLISLRVKPRIDSENGVFLDLVESRLENLELGNLPMAGMIRSMAEKLLTEHLAEAFPKEALMAAKIPFGSVAHLELDQISVEKDSIVAEGLLRSHKSIEQGFAQGFANSEKSEPFEMRFNQETLNVTTWNWNQPRGVRPSRFVIQPIDNVASDCTSRMTLKPTRNKPKWNIVRLMSSK